MWLEEQHPGDGVWPPVKGRALEPDYLGLHPRHKIDQPGNPEQSLPLFVLSHLVYKIGIRWA